MLITYEYRYVIPMEPVAWTAHKGFGRKSFNPHYKEKEAAMWHLRKQHAEKDVLECPVMLEFLFEMPIPKSMPKKKLQLIEQGEKIFHVKRKDLTNCIKFAEDCLKGIVIKDDNQVCITKAQKYYSLEPKIIIHIYTLEI